MKYVKVSDLIDHSHSLMNEVVTDTARVLGGAEYVIKIDDCLKMRGLSQKDLSLMTGLRLGTISDMVNGKGISFNKTRIIAVMVALRITDINDLISIRMPKDIEEVFNKESAEWIKTKEMPESVKKMYMENVMKNQGL